MIPQLWKAWYRVSEHLVAYQSDLLKTLISYETSLQITQQSEVDKLPNRKTQQTIHISCHHALQMKKCIDIGFYSVEYHQQEKCDWIPSTRPGSMSVNGNCWEFPPKTAYLDDLTSCHHSLYCKKRRDNRMSAINGIMMCVQHGWSVDCLPRKQTGP